jgi:hypothetical protein
MGADQLLRDVLGHAATLDTREHRAELAAGAADLVPSA